VYHPAILQSLRPALRPSLALTLIVVGIGWFTTLLTFADEALYPKYKPSARSPDAIDIRSNAYGASSSAPNALQIADVVPGFVLPQAGGGTISLKSLYATGPAALVFYRGHW
jgi:hypothetical protein